MSNKGSKESKTSRYLKVPMSFLIKVKDFYLKGMTEYSDRVGAYGMVMGCPTATGQVNSVSSTKSHDLRELVRAASTRSLGNKLVRSELLQRQQARQSPNSSVNGANNMPRSRGVGIGRIDEDKPCDFEKDDVFPRSRSYAVTKTKGVFNL